ncbi:MAG: TldD/PmbA family protein [Acidimicrobiales bacterium]
MTAGSALSGLPLEAVRSAALGRASELGCSHAGVRIERIRSQVVALRDGGVETASDDVELGVGLRVVHQGRIGFAATVEVHPDAAAALADQAVEMARATSLAAAVAPPVELAGEPVYPGLTWEGGGGRSVDPTEVPLSDKVALLSDWSGRLLGAAGVDHVRAWVMAVAEDKHYADSAGTVTTQSRVRMHPVLEAVSVAGDGSFTTMRTLAPPVGRGWEYLAGGGAGPAGYGGGRPGGVGAGGGGGAWDWDAELAQLPELLAEKSRAPSVEAGTYDLVVDPSNLWLTIHESIGHATELDRALGYEAAYAGTSFATFDQLGSLRYGSPVMHVTGDRTTPHGLATVAWDDEGVEAQSFDLVRDGVLVGYQLDRAMAAANGFGRSNGCAFACSPLLVPMQRMANVSLQPAPGPGPGPTTAELWAGVERGIYVVGDKSWSIDMQRYNFQFTGQRFYRIEKGRLAGQLRDVAYQARTTDFWGSMEAVGGASTWVLGGAFNCGKGQPGQIAPVSHGCPSGLFRGVNVLNTRAEAGR